MHPSRLSACLGVGLALLLAAAVTGPAPVYAQNENVSLVQALDRYERGDRAVVSAISRINNGPALYRNLEKYGPNWAKALGEAEKPRRLLVMATFALEAAGGSLVSPPDALALIEFVCDRMRPPKGSATPLPAERLWHRAALGVLEAKGNYMAVQMHLWHLNRRFKDEPSALMARAWVKQSEWEAIPGEVSGMSMPFDVVAWPPQMAARLNSFPYRSMVNQGLAPGVYGRLNSGYGGFGSSFGVASTSLFGPNGPRGVSVAPAPRDITSSIWSKPEEKVKVAGRVIKEYEKALAEPSVAPEAHLRLGYLYYVSRKMELARSHLAAAARTTTARDHLYLVELFSGWADEREFRTDAAEAAYRRALAHVPNGRTAITWLATLLQGRGKVEEAQTLVDASLEASARVPDPWPAFAQGDFRNWASTMEKLRGELWAGAPRVR